MSWRVEKQEMIGFHGDPPVALAPANFPAKTSCKHGPNMDAPGQLKAPAKIDSEVQQKSTRKAGSS